MKGEIPRGPKLWLAPKTPGGELEFVRVTAGVTDDSFTEIVADDPTGLEGREVVLGYATANMNFKSGDTSNPFMPKFPKRNKNKGTAPEVKKQ